MSNPWGRAGAWADDAEREEREEAAAAAAVPSSVSNNFPTLKEASTAKPKKKKMSLNEFISETSATSAPSFQSKDHGTFDMRILPTGPKQRTPEELQYGRIGGGFSNYGRTGSFSGNRPRDQEDGRDGSFAGGGRRHYRGGFDEEQRGPPNKTSNYDLPSRADEVDNWATMKKPIPTHDSGRGGRFAYHGSGGSRADEIDNWAAGKKSIPPSGAQSTFGSGFRDNSGMGPERWTRGSSFGDDIGRESVRERPRLVLDPPKGNLAMSDQAVRTNKSNPFGAARPREEVLAQKGLDWKKLEVEMDVKKSTSQSSRPNTGHSSRPSSAHSTSSETLQQQESLENVIAKPKPKVNPFGDAKPREVLLKERGQDWRKIDIELEHRGVGRPETEEEKLLKEEIMQLKQKCQNESVSQQTNGVVDTSQILDIISEKEKMLETLILELDDKVRFGQKAVERPGSGAGRAAGISERPPSQSGSVDESRNAEVMTRPPSRGKPDVWTRPSDDRRSFNRNREGGFVGNREFDRSRSRGGW